ncbi:hypothetical protein [Petrimonas sp.]
MGSSVSRLSLARANQDKGYHIFEKLVYYLVTVNSLLDGYARADHFD